MKTAAILNGGRSPNDGIDAIQASIQHMLMVEGWRIASHVLRDVPLAHCRGCFQCWTQTPGLCRAQDDGHVIVQSVIQSDLLVILSPITFGGYSAVLKRIIDRLICLISPFFERIDGETHHRARYERYPAIMGVGLLDRPQPDEEAIFHRLIERNAVNLHAPFHHHAVVYAEDYAPHVDATLKPLVQRTLEAS